MEATDRTTLEQENAPLREQLAERDLVIQRLAELIARLERRIASLEKDSSNSSKPPSSDPPSAAKPKPALKPRTKKPAKKGSRPFDFGGDGQGVRPPRVCPPHALKIRGPQPF